MAQPVLRVSRGRFPDRKVCSKESIEDSATPLVRAIEAQPMDTLQAMLAQRPILGAAGVTFDKIANDEALWVIERAWRA